MLKKIVIFFTILLTTLSAQVDLSPYYSKIEKIDKNKIFIRDDKRFKVGSSGVIMHSFDSSHKAVVAVVTVVEKRDDFAVLNYKKFSDNIDNALPSYNIDPKVGDEVILNYLYKKALAITPNRSVYNYVEDKFNYIEWIHPDIFASYLFINYRPKPSKDDFKQECLESDFALLFFAIENRGYFVDCNSFIILDQIDIENKETDVKVPFYNRIDEIKGRVFALIGGESIVNYDRYYKNLLGIK